VWKTPLYIRIDKDPDSHRPRIGLASSMPMAHVPNTIVVLKLDLELDETIFTPAFDTNTTVSITRENVDVSSVVAGLKQIDKDVKGI